MELIPRLEVLTERFASVAAARPQRATADLIGRVLAERADRLLDRNMRAAVLSLWGLAADDGRDVNARRRLLAGLAAHEHPDRAGRLQALTEKDIDFGVRKTAAELLIAIRDETAIMPITEFMFHPDPQFRETALLALQTWSDAPVEARPLFETALDLVANDPNSDVKIRAIQILTEFAGDRARPGPAFDRDALVRRLVGALRDPLSEIPSEAIYALRALRDPRVMKPVLAVLNDPEGDLDAREAAAYAIADLTAKEDRNAVVAELQTTFARSAGEKFGPIRQGIVFSLGQIGGVDVVRALADVMETDESLNVRLAAVSAMANDPGGTATQALAKVAKEDKEARIRQVALVALGPRAGGELRDLLYEIANNDPSEDVQIAARQALKERGQFLEEIIEDLRSSDSADPDTLERRREAVEEIGALAYTASALGIDMKLALDTLIKILSDPDTQLRDAAVSAITRFPHDLLNPAIRSALEAPEAGQRHGALRVIAKNTDPTFQDVVIQLITEDSSLAVRAEAAKTVGSFLNVQILDRLLAAIERSIEPAVQAAGIRSATQILWSYDADLIPDPLLRDADRVVEAARHRLSLSDRSRTAALHIAAQLNARNIRSKQGEKVSKGRIQKTVRYFLEAADSVIGVKDPSKQVFGTKVHYVFRLKPSIYSGVFAVAQQKSGFVSQPRPFLSQQGLQQIGAIPGQSARTGILTELATFYDDMGEVDRAISVYEAIILELSPMKHRLGIWLANTLVRLERLLIQSGRTDRAVGVAKSALFILSASPLLTQRASAEPQAELVVHFEGALIDHIDDQDKKRLAIINTQLQKLCRAGRIPEETGIVGIPAGAEDPGFCARYVARE